MTLHEQIQEALSNNPNGWCSKQKGDTLASLVLAMGGGTVVEVGVYAGRSLIPMAMAVKHCNHGRVIGIDPFTVEAAVEHEQEQHKDWWERMPFDRIEHLLMENLAESGVEAWVDIIKKKSADVEPPPHIDVLHVDGNHSNPAIGDVGRFAPNVVIGGFVILDDVGWEQGCVSASIQILLDLGFVERRRVFGPEQFTTFTDDYMVLQRVAYCE